jgi:uncharacterized protein (DUF433 family)
MALDWSQCPAVESIPGKVSGAWVFRGTRLPVATIFENLEAGASIEKITEWFDVTSEQIKAVLEFAARSLMLRRMDILRCVFFPTSMGAFSS